MTIERRDLAKPVMAQFELTHSCNHRCVHCYRLDTDRENKYENVSESTVLAVAKELVRFHVFNVVITGGEPLLKENLTQKVIALLRENDIDVGLNSNITLLSDILIDYLKEYKVNLLTSCPSSDKGKYNKMIGADRYEVFLDRLQKIYEKGLRCTVNMVITQDNRNEIKTTAQFLKDLGCYSFSATPMFLNMDSPQKNLLLTIEDVERVIEDLLWVEATLNMKVDILESLPKCIFAPQIRNGTHSFLNRKCQAGRTVVGISPNGDVRPCSTNTDVYGNLLKEDITDIWTKMKKWRSVEYFPDVCKNCGWIDRCNAGCRINSRVLYGQWNSPEIWCKAPISEPPESDYKEFGINEYSRIKVNDDFAYREEYENIFVVFNRIDESFIMVNKDLLDFIISLKMFCFSNVGELANICNVSARDSDFLRIINLLINKKILDYERV